jgi:hypothetical protein
MIERIEDYKSLFDKEYNDWKLKKKNTDKMYKPKMERLERIIRHYNRKIPYYIISEDFSLWEKICDRNSNKRNFCYTIFISVHNGYLKRSDCLEPDDVKINDWVMRRKNR